MIRPTSIADQVLAALERGAVVLTSNERAARTFRQRFAAQLQSPQQVLSISAWVAAQWMRSVVDGVEERVALSAAQEMRLWETVIAADTGFSSLLRSPQLAALAMNANALLARWLARRALEVHAGSSDTAVFRRWLGQFERRCAQKKWIANEAMTAALADSISARGSFGLPQEMVLVGFDELLPAQRALTQALGGAGVRVDLAGDGELAGLRSLAECDTADLEVAQCAMWAREHVADGRRVAIVHADPAAIRPALERALRVYTDPASIDIAETRQSFEFSLGVPLATIPLVRHALLLLRLLAGPLDLEQASELIRSRYLFRSDSLTTRAEFDAFSLRKDKALRAEVSTDVIARLMRERKNERELWPALHELADGLESAWRILRSSAHATWSGWADLFRDVLTKAHFISQPRESSFEYQVRRRWDDLLDELTRLQVVEQEVSRVTAMETLRRLCADTLFAPESKDAPVQVMSPAEAAGSWFDGLWLMGADDASWPQSASTHPLLPFSLQAEAGMPGAAWEQGAERARLAAERLMRSAGEFVVSYAVVDAKGEHARLSRLFAHEELSQFPLRAIDIASPIALVHARDSEAVPAPSSSVMRGGSRILELQAACSFRAFAELRLFSTPPGETADGMDAGERGEKIHTVLERFWYAVGTRTALQAISQSEPGGGPTRRQLMLEEIVDNVLSGPRTSQWETHYLELERERMLGLANRWLDFELTRVDFSVNALEHTMPEIEIGPLRLNLRVDRIDRLHLPNDETGLLLIDYKTSPHSPAKWDGARPDQPQLPLYAAVLNSDELVGMAFGNLAAGAKDLGLKGISDKEIVFGEKHVCDLQAAVPEWHAALEILADEFALGSARVNPKRPGATCTYCEQHLICRVHTLVAIDDLDHGAEEDE